MFARFDENPAMTLRVIKETKRYGRTHARTDGRENSIPPTNKVCGGYKYTILLDKLRNGEDFICNLDTLYSGGWGKSPLPLGIVT